MIGFQPVEMWRGLGRYVRVGAGRLGECVNDDMKLLSLKTKWIVFRDM